MAAELIQKKSSAQKGTETILEVKDFSVKFKTFRGELNALDRINLELKNGEILGIIGESGSGKSTLALSLMGMIPENGKVEGRVRLFGKTVAATDISGEALLKMKRKKAKILSEKLRNIRWKDVSMVFQGSMNAFNPVYTIYKQIAEVYRIHTDYDEERIRKKVTETVKRAGLNPVILNSFPHELSGGMKQRAVIAMALALNPSLVIADEPTTGLDVVTQARIITELKNIVIKRVNSMMIISHDIGVVAQLATRVVVLYSGWIMESGSIEDIYLRPSNPYTKASLESYPSIASEKIFMKGIPGTPPDPINPPPGCRFAPRCFFAREICSREEPPFAQVEPGHFSKCHFAAEVISSGGRGKVEVKDEQFGSGVSADDKVLIVENLSKFYDLRTSLAGRLFSRASQRRIVRAVDHVSLDIRTSEILGIVGESGSGKTTFGRTAIALIPSSGGDVKLKVGTNELSKSVSESDGHAIGITVGNEEYMDVTALRRGQRNYKLLRKKTQIIFQDPYDSLDPKMTVFDVIREPIIAHRTTRDPEQVLMMVRDTLASVKLTPPENFLYRYPHELSGGERQRVAAARALVLRPEVLVADEPISMLDVSLRAGFMNLLLELRNRFGVTIIYITHDIASARYVSDRIVVLYLGIAVEMGSSEDIVRYPHHPYTRALIDAVPNPTPNWNPRELKIVGDIGNAVNVPKGCRFYERCVYAQDMCRVTPPPVQTDGAHWYLCHFTQEQLAGITPRSG